MKSGIDYELSLNSEVRDQKKLSYSVSLQIYFQTNVLNKVRILNCKSGLLALISKWVSVEREFGVEPFLAVFGRVIKELEVPVCVKENLIDSRLLPNVSVIGESQAIELSHPIFSNSSDSFCDHCSHMFFFVFEWWELFSDRL